MDPFVGEISMFSYNWAPQGWALCNGAQLNITQNAALYSLLGTRFGGNGSTTFNLPDLRGRTPYGTTNPNSTGQSAGAESVTLTAGAMPLHAHTLYASSANATKGVAAGANDLLGTTSAQPIYAPNTSTPVQLNPSTVSIVGGQAHENMQPSLVVNFCIALLGMYPQRN